MYVSASPCPPLRSTNGRVSPNYTSEWTVAEDRFSPSVAGFSDAWLTAQNHNPNYMVANYMVAPEVTHEFNLLNGFLRSGGSGGPSIQPAATMLPPSSPEQGKATPRPGSVLPTERDKAREYFFQ